MLDMKKEFANLSYLKSAHI
ncbi:unnamed protein product [Cuscuta epithymum]|uniref:Uncharacterized protein n=1 Tax=Cuscuta epithymum TaxID=186058 RepID=A0AAV0EUL7_9ASTE|nr:unnamed protein product [Cuscuta epithymum]